MSMKALIEEVRFACARHSVARQNQGVLNMKVFCAFIKAVLLENMSGKLIKVVFLKYMIQWTDTDGQTDGHTHTRAQHLLSG